MMQLPKHHQYGGAFLSWKNIWHDWGNSQMQALTACSPLLNDQRLVKQIRLEADGFLARLIAEGRLHQIDLADNTVREFPQIAYGIRCQTVGLLGLYQITGQEKYAKLAGLTAAWLVGENAAQFQMYDARTGRVYDGINDSSSVNKNSGAESTIEGLYALIEIIHHPIAKRYLKYNIRKNENTKDLDDVEMVSTIFYSSDGKQLTIRYDKKSMNFEIIE